MNQPLLSICIPTYNRAEYLDQCLKAIVEQDGFDDRVEIVISDNCSTDETKERVKAYSQKYSNIRYFRNEENLADRNFPLSLQRATGILRKLTNDTVIYQPGAIRYMLDIVEKYSAERPQIYFLASGKLEKDQTKADTIEQYIDTVGFNLTWIRGLAVWDEDCEDLEIFISEAASKMSQVPFLLHHFEKHGGAVICDRSIMGAAPMGKKDISYGLYQVFYTNFLGFIQPYVSDGRVSRECYENLRKKLLFDFFAQWIINVERQPGKYVLSDENLANLIRQEYGKEAYYAEFRRQMRKPLLRAKLGRLLKRG